MEIDNKQEPISWPFIQDNPVELVADRQSLTAYLCGFIHANVHSNIDVEVCTISILLAISLCIYYVF